MNDPHSPDGSAGWSTVRTATRRRLSSAALDAQLSENHRARVVDDAARAMDPREFYLGNDSTGGGGGRPAHDPQVLMGLWLLAILDGVGSARELSRLVDEPIAYRWLAHGVPVSYHALSSFSRRS